MSQVRKLNYVDSKLGAPVSGQQTTRIIWDSLLNVGTGTSAVFFQNFNNKTIPFTNLTTNKLDSSESMVIKTITLFQWTTAGVLESFNGGDQAALSVFVGNQCVVKRLPIAQNSGRGDASPFDRLHGLNAVEQAGTAGTANQKAMPCEIRLLTDIVIPPQTEFYVRVDSASLTAGTGRILCALSGYGKIFSAGNSF
jgi:hypothetical protein